MPDPAASVPSVVRNLPTSGQTGVLLNPVIDIEFSESLEPTTVNANNVLLHQSASGSPIVSAKVSLIGGDRVIRIVPDNLLLPNTSYFFDILDGLRDLDGNPPNFSTFRSYFTTEDSQDNQPPSVTLVSPPGGETDVGVNASINIRFDEPINPLTVTGASVLISDGTQTVVPCTINFSNNDQAVMIVPHTPLTPQNLYSLTIDGIEDLAGNAVTRVDTQFTTGDGPDTVTPIVVSNSPLHNATDVPVNAVVTIELNEPIDPVSVNSSSVSVEDQTTFQDVSGALSVAGNGRLIHFVPDNPWAAGREFDVSFSSFFNRRVVDLAGNQLTGFFGFTFTTDFAADTAPPQVVGVSPTNGLADVPINSQIVVQFDEPIQSFSVGGVTLTANGPTINVNRSLIDANQTVILTPVVPLPPLTIHTVSISNVDDLSGNALLTPVATTFITETGADLIRPTITTVSPNHGTIDVPTDTVVTIQFSERINPLTVTTASFFLEQLSPSFVRIDGSITVAADGLSATFTPDNPLNVSANHRVRVLSGITDFVGHSYNGSSVPSNFTTAAQ